MAGSCNGLFCSAWLCSVMNFELRRRDGQASRRKQQQRGAKAEYIFPDGFAQSWPFAFKMFLDFLSSVLPFVFRQEECRSDEIDHGAARENKKTSWSSPYLPTVGRKTAAMVVEMAMLMSRRDAHAVGTDARGHEVRRAASHTHTPGRTANEAMKQ